MLIRPTYRTRTIGSGVPSVDWNNPISRGLVGAYLPSAFVGPTIYDLSLRGANLAVQSGTTFRNSYDGAGLYGDGSGEGAIATPTTAQQPTTGASVFARAWKVASPGNVVSFGVANVNAGFTGSNGFCIQATSVDTAYLECTVDSTAFGGTEVAWTNPIYSWGASFTPGGNMVLYRDGESKDTTAIAGTALAYGSGGNAAKTTIFRIDADSARTPNLVCHVMYVWNRPLAANEHLSLALEPYQLLSFADDEMFNFKGTAAAASGFRFLQLMGVGS